MDHQGVVTEAELLSAQQRLEKDDWENSKIFLSVEQSEELVKSSSDTSEDVGGRPSDEA